MSDRSPVLGLVAHDDRKAALAQWCVRHQSTLSRCDLYATGTTGGLILDTLPLLRITRLKSGPLGGDQQLGALVAESKVDALVFFVDALSPHPHDVDVKALIRMATLATILFACNEATADAVIHAVVQTLEEAAG